MKEPLTVGALVELLADHDKKEVSVRGILSIQREDHSLADIAREIDPKRKLWVYFHHASLGTREKDLLSYHGKAVVATGILDRGKKGHFGIFPASLTIRSLSFT
jgi:hypothetical protein